MLQVHATNAWVELNTQCSTSTRRGRRVAKLVDWLNEREEHEELELVIEEDLIAYCTTELRAFCGEADGGIEEVFSAGAAAACEAVLRCPDGQTGSGHLLATAFMHGHAHAACDALRRRCHAHHPAVSGRLRANPGSRRAVRG